MNAFPSNTINNENYYGNIRNEIFPLLPERVTRILEIGCGTGNTLKHIKIEKRCEWTGGVELFSAAAQEARSKIDVVYEGNIELMELPVPLDSLDVILCLDVLEHLVDPWNLIMRLHHLLKQGGVLIASIPNVRYYQISLSLLCLGQWNYTSEGCLDKTHLRFFTLATALQLIESSGLKIDKVQATGLEQGRWAHLVNKLSFSFFKQLLEYQYLLRARRVD